MARGKKRESKLKLRQLEGDIFVAEAEGGEGNAEPTAPRQSVPPPPEISPKDRRQMELMLTRWRRALTIRGSMVKQKAEILKTGSQLRRDVELPLLEYRLAVLERALADIAKAGRGLGVLEDVCRPYIEFSTAMFVNWTAHMLAEYKRLDVSAEEYLQKTRWDVAALAMKLGVTKKAFVEAFNDSQVQGTLHADGHRKAAIVLAALLLEKDPRTMYRWFEKQRERGPGKVAAGEK